MKNLSFTKKFENTKILIVNLVIFLSFSIFIYSNYPFGKKFQLSLLILGILIIISILSIFKTYADMVNLNQMLLIYDLLLASIGIILLSNINYFSKLGGKITLPITCLILILALIIFIALISINKNNIVNFSFTSYFPLLIICIIILFTSFYLINSWIRWDSYSYSYAFNLLSIETINSDLARLCGHISYAYAIIAFIFNQIINNYGITLRLINILMLVIETACVFHLLKYLFPNNKKYFYFITTALFAFSPFTYGMLGTISLENFMMFGIVTFIFFRIKELYILSYLSFMCLLFSKENGVVIAAGIVLGFWVYDIVKTKTNLKNNILQSLKIQFNLPAMLGFILWLYCYLIHHWGVPDEIIYTVDNSKFNAFNYSAIFIYDKIRTLFVSNFNWLFISCIIIFLIICIIKHKINSDWYVLCPFIFANIASMIINISYVTFNHIRYWQCDYFGIYILFVYLFVNVTNKTKKQNIILSFIAVILFIQNYYTIDPLMQNVLTKYSIGNGNIVTAQNLVLGQTQISFCDGAVYNRQSHDFDRAYDMVLKKISFNNDDILLLSDEYSAPTVNGEVRSLYMITGYGYDCVEYPQYVAWNGNKRILTNDITEAMPTIYVNSDFNINSYPSGQEFIYVEMPWGDTFFNKYVSDKLKIIDSETLSYHNWTLKAIRLIKE